MDRWSFRKKFVVGLVLLIVGYSIFKYFTNKNEDTERSFSKNEILHLELHGVIMNGKKFLANLKKFKKDDAVKAIVIDIDVDKERIALGLKQVTGDPMESLGPVKKGDIVTCTVTEVTDSGIEVAVGELKAFIRKNELSRDRAEQRPDRYAVGDKIDVRVTNVDKAARKISLSIKAAPRGMVAMRWRAGLNSPGR